MQLGEINETLLIVGALVLAIVAAGSYQAAEALLLAVASQKWEEVEGRITERGGGHGAPRLVYEYLVDGRTYSNDRVYPVDVSQDARSEFVRTFAMQPVPAAVRVYVNPQNPSQAALVRGASPGLAGQLIFSPAMAALGVALIYFSLPFYRRRLAAQRDALAERWGTNSVGGQWSDPSEIPDPIAPLTQWSLMPMRIGMPNCTHRLVQTDPARLEFRATLGGWSAFAMFFAFGLLIVGFGVWQGVAGDAFAAVLCLSLGLVACGITGSFLRYITMPRVFDNRLGFWKGWREPRRGSRSRPPKDFVELREIYAIQLLQERVRPRRGRSYTQAQLNLVLYDARRINVVTHGGTAELRREARILAAFLEKPLWDVT